MLSLYFSLDGKVPKLTTLKVLRSAMCMQASHCPRLNALFTATFLVDPYSRFGAGIKKLALQAQTCFYSFRRLQRTGIPTAERKAGRIRLRRIGEQYPFSAALGQKDDK